MTDDSRDRHPGPGKSRGELRVFITGPLRPDGLPLAKGPVELLLVGPRPAPDLLKRFGVRIVRRSRDSLHVEVPRRRAGTFIRTVRHYDNWMDMLHPWARKWVEEHQDRIRERYGTSPVRIQSLYADYRMVWRTMHLRERFAALRESGLGKMDAYSRIGGEWDLAAETIRRLLTKDAHTQPPRGSRADVEAWIEDKFVFPEWVLREFGHIFEETRF